MQHNRANRNSDVMRDSGWRSDRVVRLLPEVACVSPDLLPDHAHRRLADNAAASSVGSFSADSYKPRLSFASVPERKERRNVYRRCPVKGRRREFVVCEVRHGSTKSD